MADFHLWSKESLVRFAEEAAVKMLAQEKQIDDLLREKLRHDVQDELAKPATSDTVNPSSTFGA
jgi:hypothetical protein